MPVIRESKGMMPQPSLCRLAVFCFVEDAPFRLTICYHGGSVRSPCPGAGNLTDAELQAVARKSVGVLKELGPEIKWLHSYVTGDKVYCVYLAPDEETIREHARRGGFPANRISAVRRMIDPNTAK